MAVEILMPKLGMIMEEGNLIEWMKYERDYVETGDIVCIIETDKVTFEVESPCSGLLVIFQKPADNIKTGALIGYIAENESEYEQIQRRAGSEILEVAELASGPEKLEDYQLDQPQSIDIKFTGKLRASPAARALAKKNEISLNAIKGTGPKGRITKEDVKYAMNFPELQSKAARQPHKIEATAGARKLAKEKGVELALIQGTGPNQCITRRDVLQAVKTANFILSPSAVQQATVPLEAKQKRILKEEEMASIRQTISLRMMESLGNSAQMTAFAEWDATELLKLRRLLNAQQASRGYKITIPGLVVFLLARVLKKMPIFNASVDGKKIIYWSDVNIGIAVSVGENLLVPVVHGAERKTISEIQQIIDDLIERARNKKLLPDDMHGGTFTLSNVGSYGSTWETVILNPPQVALLGIGVIEKKPVVKNDEILIREVMPVSLTFDHRVIDGATAGKFRQRMKMLVENPGQLITYFPER